MMKILVTGGLGAVGPFVVRRTAAAGARGFGVSDLCHHHDQQYLRCDVSEYRQAERLFERLHFDYVYPPGGGVRALERRGLLRGTCGGRTSSGPKKPDPAPGKTPAFA